MHIERYNKKYRPGDPSKRIQEMWDHQDNPELDPNREIESPHDMLLTEPQGGAFLHWQAPEFEMFERDKKWYLVMGLILATIVSWAIYTNSPIMAITFILIGVVGYIYAHTEPRVLDFIITREGVIAGRELYSYDNLESFWIFYEPEGIRVISLHTKSHFLPYVHIPIEHENPVQIREILLRHIPEEKHEPGLVDTLERLLRI
jgi:hypothetical protein